MEETKESKPFLNFICDVESWPKLLSLLHDEKTRYSIPTKYVDRLVDRAGPPLYMTADAFECHIYPPNADAENEVKQLQTAVELYKGTVDELRAHEIDMAPQETIRSDCNPIYFRLGRS